MGMLPKIRTSNAHALESDSYAKLRDRTSSRSKSLTSGYAKTPSSGSKHEFSLSKSQTSSSNSLDLLISQVSAFTGGYRRSAVRPPLLEPIDVQDLTKFALPRPDKEFYAEYLKKDRRARSSGDRAEKEKRLEDRKRLKTPETPRDTGPKPPPIEHLAKRKPKRPMMDIESARLLRNKETGHGYEPMMYNMWLEAGKQELPFPDRPDPNYNSNVWRNFRKSYGFHTDVDGRNIKEMIAQVYPVNLPPPSRIGEFSYPRFLNQIMLIKDDRLRRFAIECRKKDIQEFRLMRLRNEARNPPIDELGNIMPPPNFKKHPHKFIPVDDDTTGRPPSPEPRTRLDLFGRKVPVLKTIKQGPCMWKLSYRLNNPQYEKVLEEFERKKKELESKERQTKMTPIRGMFQ